MIWELNVRVADQSEVVVPCVTRERQYMRVAGWRSTVGVYEVIPPAPSGTLVGLANTVNGAIAVDAADEKSLLSETWNSYTFAPL